MSQIKWFYPKKHTGWKKSQADSTRRMKLLSASSKAKTSRNRYLEAGRRANALANVTRDKKTEKKARSDAKYFYAKADKLKEVKK